MDTRATLLSMIALVCACSAPDSTQDPALVTLHTSEVGATLFVDARPQGPAREGLEVGLLRGQHVLELRRGEQVIAMTVVDLPPGARAEITLQADPQLAAPSLPSAPVGSPVTEPVPPASPTGRTRIVARPPAEVFGDGVALGTTPLVVDLGPGTHALELRAEGHVAQHVDVQVSAGEERTIEVTLARSAGDPPSRDDVPRARDGVPRARDGVPPAGDVAPPARDVSRTVSPAEIRATIAGAREDLQRCYTPDPAHPASIRVDVSLTIAPSGRPSSAEVAGPDAPVPLRACIARTAREMRFPEALEQTRTTFPVVFTGR